MRDVLWLVNYNPILRVAGIGMAAATLLLIGAVACWYELSRAGGVALLVLCLFTAGGTVTMTVLMVIETHTDGTHPQKQPNFMQYVSAAKRRHVPSSVRSWQP